MSDNDPAIAERLEKGSVSAEFPLAFESGWVVGNMVLGCSNCVTPYAPNQLRGSVSKLSPSCFLIEAAGQCESCGAKTRFDIKLFDDKSVETMVNGGPWEKRSLAMAEPPGRNAMPPPSEMPSSQQIQMAKLGSCVMSLRLGWSAVYAYSVWPAIEQISNGAANTYTDFFLGNAALTFLGYVCSVILAVGHFRKA
ncbi:hypothetical protein [Pseudomonas putida]|uniref:Uncharacterized protein n=1 Tax=Pseudomonas putida TaxID=303 RepID=A0A8I1EEJ9_PSEPU|nr:hypothetical protein [Pseudomonas putida]MBI6885180.1 hypothetical protein [Pseudomonas putida]